MGGAEFMSFTVNVIAGSYANRVLHYCLHLQHGNYNSLNNVLGSEYSCGSTVCYAPGDALKLMNPSPILDGIGFGSPVSDAFTYDFSMKSNIAAKLLQLDKCRKLVQFAERCLKEGTDYFYGIEACNEVLDGHPHEIGPTLKHDCLCTRAALLLKRKWKNDAHMAIRDCNRARRIDTSSFKALFYMSEALLQLNKHKEALEFAVASQCLAPYDSEVAERVEDIKKRLAAVVLLAPLHGLCESKACAVPPCSKGTKA
ncbi:hypothetical protein CK203_107425 [Vitis vinifera]|uniref:Uncharacterized protein n=1 Tax=Vitis vinifera TaxID=29760 RepID=A0A438F7R3_VITVI|nr:hypothetical protein CK203_107425 [Vitis vinifera]